jgi:hypothetical protein
LKGSGSQLVLHLTRRDGSVLNRDVAGRGQADRCFWVEGERAVCFEQELSQSRADISAPFKVVTNILALLP